MGLSDRFIVTLKDLDDKRKARERAEVEELRVAEDVLKPAVIDLFENLVREGRTILLVTHDKDVAKRGSRIITLSDGEIVGAESAALTSEGSARKEGNHA